MAHLFVKTRVRRWEGDQETSSVMRAKQLHVPKAENVVRNVQEERCEFLSNKEGATLPCAHKHCLSKQFVPPREMFFLFSHPPPDSLMI